MLGFDVNHKQTTNVSNALIEFVHNIDNFKAKIGAVCMNKELRFQLDVVQRDMPQMDLDHLIISLKDQHQVMSHIYDLMMVGFKLLPKYRHEKYMVVIIGSNPTKLGAANKYNLKEIIDLGVHVIAIVLIKIDNELSEFLNSYGCKIIDLIGNSEAQDGFIGLKEEIFGEMLI